jgi:hypothetical protein
LRKYVAIKADWLVMSTSIELDFGTKLTKNAVYSILHNTSNAKIFQTIVLK